MYFLKKYSKVKRENKRKNEKRRDGIMLVKEEEKKEQINVTQTKTKRKVVNKKKFIMAICILVFFLILLGILGYKGIQNYQEEHLQPELQIKGEKKITLKLGEEYIEQGASAKAKEEDISDRIARSGEVDNQKIGEYVIRYQVTNQRGKQEKVVERKVHIIDDVKPEIKLNGSEKVEIAKGEKYKEEGAKATDNYNGDLTEKIQITGEVKTDTIGEYTVTYTVADESGNEASATRTVQVKEKKAVASTSGKGLPVLMYHNFYDKNNFKAPNNNWMEISDFEAQVKYLTENDYYFPTWKEVEDFIDGKITLPSKSVVITSDDGDDSFFDLAIPILKKYQAKGTSFVITIHAASDVKKYQSDLISLESHSHDMHRPGKDGKGRILTIPKADAVKDLKKSQEILGGSTVFCYPFGHYNDAAKAAIKEAGFKLAFTIKYGRVYKGSNKLELPRIRMSKGVTLNQFKAMVK